MTKQELIKRIGEFDFSNAHTFLMGYFRHPFNYAETLKEDVDQLFSILQDVQQINNGVWMEDDIIFNTNIVGLTYILALEKYDETAQCILPYTEFKDELYAVITEAEKEFDLPLSDKERRDIFS